MKLIDLLQCDSCKKNLEDFVKMQDNVVGEELYKILEEYTVFCELRRLKEKSTPPVTITESPFLPKWSPYTLTC